MITDTQKARWVALRSQSVLWQKKNLLSSYKKTEYELRQCGREIGRAINALRQWPPYEWLKNGLEALHFEDCRKLASSPLIDSIEKAAGGIMVLKTKSFDHLEQSQLCIEVSQKNAQMRVRRKKPSADRDWEELVDLSKSPVIESVAQLLMTAGRLDILVAVVLAESLQSYEPPNKKLSRSLMAQIKKQRFDQLSRIEAYAPEQTKLEKRYARLLRRQERLCQELIQTGTWLLSIDQADPLDAATLEDEYDRLCKLPQVRQISVHDAMVRVLTETISIADHEGQVHRIGEFQIDIDMANNQVKMQNLDLVQVRLLGGFHHPHVSSDAAPCLGSLRSFFANCFRAGKIVDIIVHSVEFLRSYNERDCFCSVNNWPTT
jgi:hypothetical protein